MEMISNLKIEDVYINSAQKICKEYDKENQIFLKIKGITDNGSYVEFPVIKYQYNNILS